ncbi:MAG: putative lipid II flippase MurJ [Planctomycetota bacterium]|nr:MAG: putative lipid II flippase MurJ [Planctomycetota bacterium]
MLTLLSRVLGMLRDVLTAHLLGAGMVSDALTYAWTLPNAFRRLFGEGALSSALVPALTRAEQEQGRQAARALVCQIVSTLVLGLSALVALIIAGLSVAQWWFPSLASDPSAALTLRFTQLLLPYMVVVSVLAQLVATLNVFGEFARPAAVPSVLNLVWIVGVGAATWFGPEVTLQPGAAVDALAEGAPQPAHALIIIASIFLASVVQVFWLLPRLRALGLGLRFVRPRLSPEVRGVLAAMGPMILGMGAAQLNILADRTIAKVALPDGGTTHLYYGMRLMQFPLGLVSVALVTTVFPALARLATARNHAGAVETARTALRANLLLCTGAATGLFVLATPIVAMLFEGGSFSPENTRLTSSALLGYALGIPCAGTVMLLTRTSIAAGDLRLPARIGVLMVFVNITLDLALVGPLGELGLALATSVASLGSAILLLVFVAPRVKARPSELLGGWFRPLLVALVMGAAVHLLDGRLLAASAPPLVRVACGSLLGLVVFASLARALCPAAWRELAGLLPGRR